MADRQPEEWGEEYRHRRETYLGMSKRIAELLEFRLADASLDVANVEHRAKSVDSLVSKIRRKNKYEDPLQEVTDLAGVRVVTYYLEDIDLVAEIVREEIDIDHDLSHNVGQPREPDRFGYMSLHFVGTLPAARVALSDWSLYSGLTVEIQVRTAIQHAWAAIDHKLRYKKRDLPQQLERDLFRLSALLEVADTEFSRLRDKASELHESYADRIARGRLDLPIDSSSLEAYLKSTRHHLRWTQVAIQAGWGSDGELEDVSMYDFYPPTGMTDLQKALAVADISTLEQLDEVMNAADAWGVETLTGTAEQVTERDEVVYPVPGHVLMALVARGRLVSRDALSDFSLRDSICDAIYSTYSGEV